jgi:N-carbamoyl-L-amino-acid hydrolase
VLSRIEEQMLAIIREIELRRNVSFELGRRASASVGVVDADIVMQMEEAARDLGIRTMKLGSPASHDAAAFAAAGVPAGMLFVRNEHGSHNPQEHMEIDDFLDACAVLARWVADHAV